jgi:hypothetical protein
MILRKRMFWSPLEKLEGSITWYGKLFRAATRCRNSRQKHRARLPPTAITETQLGLRPSQLLRPNPVSHGTNCRGRNSLTADRKRGDLGWSFFAPANKASVTSDFSVCTSCGIKRRDPLPVTRAALPALRPWAGFALPLPPLPPGIGCAETRWRQRCSRWRQLLVNGICLSS